MEDKVYYKVSEEELIDLLSTRARYDALENAGVDNWDYYGEAFHDFWEWYINECPDIIKQCDKKDCKYFDSVAIARYEIANYDKME